MDELSSKLSAMADLDDELKQLRTKLEMTAKQNVDMLIKLQAWHTAAGRAAATFVSPHKHVQHLLNVQLESQHVLLCIFAWSSAPGKRSIRPCSMTSHSTCWLHMPGACPSGLTSQILQTC